MRLGGPDVGRHHPPRDRGHAVEGRGARGEVAGARRVRHRRRRLPGRRRGRDRGRRGAPATSTPAAGSSASSSPSAAPTPARRSSARSPTPASDAHLTARPPSWAACVPGCSPLATCAALAGCGGSGDGAAATRDDARGDGAQTRPPAPARRPPRRDGRRAPASADPWTHLQALDAIGRRNGGTRAAGTPGGIATENLVAARLRAAGWTVRFQRVTFPFFDERRPPLVALAGGRRLAAGSRRAHARVLVRRDGARAGAGRRRRAGRRGLPGG